MLKSKILHSIIFVLFLCSASSAFSEGLELTYKVETVQDAREEGEKPKIEKTNNIEQVILLPHKFSVKTADIENIYDFTSRRIITVNHKNKTFENNSLYSIVAFRRAEFSNREMMRDMFESAQKDTDQKFKNLQSFNQFELETIFNMRSPKSSKKDIKETAEGDTRTFSFNKEIVVSATLNNTGAPRHLRDSFNKYMLYEYNIHPEIRDKLTGYNKLLSSLNYRYIHPFNTIVNVNYNLESIKEYNNDIEIPKDYKQIYSSDTLLNTILIKASDSSKSWSESKYEDEVKRLVKDNQSFDAYLTVSEYVFQYGIQSMKRIDKELLTQIFKNNSAQILHKALDAKTKEETEASIEIIKKLSTVQLTHSYVLDIFLGNNYNSLGMHQKAKEHLEKALNHNPFLTNVYTDLGNVFYRAYETQSAWKCYDEAAKIMPSNTQVEAIKNDEDKTRSLHPEYF